MKHEDDAGIAPAKEARHESGRRYRVAKKTFDQVHVFARPPFFLAV
jgi:hypothetical protein